MNWAVAGLGVRWRVRRDREAFPAGDGAADGRQHRPAAAAACAARRARSAPRYVAGASGGVLGSHRRVGGALVPRPDWLGGRRVSARRRCRGSSGTSPAAVRVGAAADRAGRVAASRGRGREADDRRPRYHGARLSHRLPLLVPDHRARDVPGAIVAPRCACWRTSHRSSGSRPSPGCCSRRRGRPHRVGRRSISDSRSGWAWPSWFSSPSRSRPSRRLPHRLDRPMSAGCCPSSSRPGRRRGARPPGARAGPRPLVDGHSSPVLLFTALLAVPVLGYGALPRAARAAGRRPA